jgi:hypothetical protein
MKKIIALSLLGCTLIAGTLNAQQDKSKRKSPPATATETIASGATITINYSQPSLKGRTIGKDVEPMKDQVWRMGANEATVFESNKDITIEGQKLSEGKYSLFGLWTDKGFTLIFNKDVNFWGTEYAAHKDNDVLKVTVLPRTSDVNQETLTYTIEKNGKVTLHWGTTVVAFLVK